MEYLLKKIKGRFHYEGGKEHFKEHSLHSLILRLKQAVKIEASAKKINKTNKECSFPRSEWKRALSQHLLHLKNQTFS